MKCYRLIIIFFILSSGLLYAQNQSYKKVKPQKGEGIHALLRRHNLNPKTYYKSFLNLNKEVLDGGTSLSLHKTYKLPNTGTTQKRKKNNNRYEPLFGKKYGSYEIVDNQLKGAVYYIVSGHGGPDPGAIGKRNGKRLCEDEYAYDIALRLSRQLMSHGATVHIIVRDPNDGIRDQEYLAPDKDETVWKQKKIPLNARKKLRQRANVVNQLYAKNKGKYQRLLVLHIDSRSKGKRIDIYGYHHSNSRTGKRFTNNIINTLERKYKKAQPNRGFSGVSKIRDGLYMVRKPYPPTCFLELGNIQNFQDQVRFTIPNNRQAIANWLTEGCIKDFKQSK